MKTYHKIWGNPLEKYVEITIDFAAWLIGFGWGNYNYSEVSFCHLHFNFGPIIFSIGWHK
jgi:hypothetical protein